MILRETFWRGRGILHLSEENKCAQKTSNNSECRLPLTRALPLQVVTLAVYTYFAAALMGAQWVQPLSAEDYVTITKLPASRD